MLDLKPCFPPEFVSSSIFLFIHFFFVMTALPRSFAFGVVGGIVVAFCLLGFGFR